jgi:2-aminoethylphosphonate-pyruvate transaminase
MDKVLFTPGPLTTSATVKAAMQRDLGSRDEEFIAVVREVRARLLAVAGVAPEAWTAVIVQGSGTFGIEATLSSCIPRSGKLLVLENGAYGARMARIASVAGIAVAVHRLPEDESPAPAEVARLLEADPAVTHVAVVHCETTTGIFNPVEEIGRVVRGAGRMLIVDAMSSFGAVPLDLEAAGVDYLVSSANKCIEGVPGFSFVVARRVALAATAGWARSVSLDLHAQWRGLEADGQFRFTPPTHALLAFRQALVELDAEGGPAGRAERYRQNREVCRRGLRRHGFEELLPEEKQGYIITSFRYPRHPRFDFAVFYRRLADRGLVIYPGKVSSADCFRIGHIGRIEPGQVEALVAAVGEVLGELGVAP